MPDPSEPLTPTDPTSGSRSNDDGPLLRVVRDRRLAFLLVGGVNTVVGALWFVLFDHLVGSWWGNRGHYLGLVLTYVCAVLCAFVLHRTLVFRVRGRVWGDLVRYSSVSVTAFGVNVVLLGLLVDGAGWRPVPAQLLITLVTTVVSWVGHNTFSFRRPAADPAGREAASPGPLSSRERS